MWPEHRRAMQAFAPLPLPERLFVRGRMFSAPLVEVASRVSGSSVLDVGCGHGAMVSLLATDHPERRVLGIDPDSRKIAWATTSVGRLPNVELRVATVESLSPELDARVDAAVISDVLYLLPVERWEPFLSATGRLLRPGGMLLLKEAEGDRSWRHLKCLAQEMLMVRVLRRTLGSGGLVLQPRAFTEALLNEAGFEQVRTTSLARGYTTPHVLFEARRSLNSGRTAPGTS
jgi:2-polyprenyl-3-methyl-5-hydroxy-6-metoxy-1,4-benzoquinol methylase